LKHLLDIHSALNAGALSEPATLAFVYRRPSESGCHTALFETLEAELDDVKERSGDQAVATTRCSSCELLTEWSSERYDQPLG
jgi:hypothetical protein